MRAAESRRRRGAAGERKLARTSCRDNYTTATVDICHLSASLGRKKWPARPPSRPAGRPALLIGAGTQSRPVVHSLSLGGRPSIWRWFVLAAGLRPIPATGQVRALAKQLPIAAPNATATGEARRQCKCKCKQRRANKGATSCRESSPAGWTTLGLQWDWTRRDESGGRQCPNPLTIYRQLLAIVFQ